MSSTAIDKFVFKPNQRIGAAAAEEDDSFLKECFVDTGVLKILRDTLDPRRVVVGRTGSGKTALLYQLAQVEDHVVQIEPSLLSLTYITNSNILNFFSELGVDLGLFYRFLWRHILVIELLREKFKGERNRQQSFMDRIWAAMPKGEAYRVAEQYLSKYTGTFWEETDHRIQEVTQTVETDLQSSIQGLITGMFHFNAAGAKKVSEEVKGEVVHRAQNVINTVQMRELTLVMKFLDEALLTDAKQRYYITIDGLDEDWTDERIRLHLIGALVRTSADFSTIRNAKIVIAIREDLLSQVYESTKGPGYQEEKIKSAQLRLFWNKSQLIEVLDRRVSFLVRERYTKREVTHSDILPSKIDRQRPIDYILDRTFMRPRDSIQFLNDCIDKAEGRAKITENILMEAEGEYSRGRIHALADEWHGIYPNLYNLSKLLRNRKTSFVITQITRDDLEDNCLSITMAGEKQEGVDGRCIDKLLGNEMDVDAYRKMIIWIFYVTGLVGLKINARSPWSWSFDKGASISKAEIDDSTRASVHKAFWRYFGIDDTHEK
jgi:hypothetical protein